MAQKKLKVAFVGSGGMAKRHSEPVASMSGVEIAGYCDVKAEAAQSMAESYGGETFDDPKTMLEKVQPDGVFLCLPPFAHGIELELVKRGIPFFIEKPIGMDLSLTKKIVQAVRKKGLLTCAGYMNRYRKSVQTAKKRMRTDPPIMVTGGWIGGTPAQAATGIMSWWVDKGRSGGQFLEQVTHTVDLVRYFCGEAAYVEAVAARGLGKNTPNNFSNDDAMLVNIKFESGAVANLWANCSANGGGGGVSLNVYANRTTALFSGWDHTVRILKKGKEEEAVDGQENIFAVEDKAFISALRSGKPTKIMSSYEDAANTLAITLAANESAETGKPVKVQKF